MFLKWKEKVKAYVFNLFSNQHHQKIDLNFEMIAMTKKCLILLISIEHYTIQLKFSFFFFFAIFHFFFTKSNQSNNKINTWQSTNQSTVVSNDKYYRNIAQQTSLNVRQTSNTYLWIDRLLSLQNAVVRQLFNSLMIISMIFSVLIVLFYISWKKKKHLKIVIIFFLPCLNVCAIIRIDSLNTMAHFFATDWIALFLFVQKIEKNWCFFLKKIKFF